MASMESNNLHVFTSHLGIRCNFTVRIFETLGFELNVYRCFLTRRNIQFLGTSKRSLVALWISKLDFSPKFHHFILSVSYRQGKLTPLSCVILQSQCERRVIAQNRFHVCCSFGNSWFGCQSKFIKELVIFVVFNNQHFGFFTCFQR